MNSCIPEVKEKKEDGSKTIIFNAFSIESRLTFAFSPTSFRRTFMELPGFTCWW